MKYTITFGRFHYETKHVFSLESEASVKLSELRAKLPYINFEVKVN